MPIFEIVTQSIFIRGLFSRLILYNFGLSFKINYTLNNSQGTNKIISMYRCVNNK